MKNGVIDMNERRDLSFEPVLIGTPVAFKKIRWAAGGSGLDAAATMELEAFAERLNVNPAVVVEIGVHSDAREGDDAAKIDQRRAQTVVDFLVRKGVRKDRLVAKGYGNARLKNHCAPWVQCTEAEHAVNRRVEYTVMELRP
jgi:outer membrane protein OmpA-like peptidoglycan-associated protein